jgi:hypothetical protein
MHRLMWDSLCGLALAAFLTIVALMAAPTHAAVLLDEANLVGLPGAAAPSEFSFTVSTPQALTLTLTDLQLPATFGT